VKVLAHRGAGAGLPEQSLAAYRAVIAAGVDGVECDVRLSADGHPVCVHDRTLDRTTGGTGRLSTTPVDALRDLGVPTLRELCRLVADAGRSLELAVETKHPTRAGGTVERAVVEVLAEFGWTAAGTGPVTVRAMSFSWLALLRIHRLAPELELVRLIDRRRTASAGLFPPGVRVAGIGLETLRRRPDLVVRVRRRGLDVQVWTVDEPDDLEFCRRLGIDTVISNRPALLRSGL
jgi:glycerophosphoryl diester phosphodiesterase